MAQSLSDHPALEMLSLWDNDIGDAGLIALGESLATNQLRELSIALNPRITDQGVVGFANALLQHSAARGNLTTLWLWGCPLVTQVGREAIADAIGTHPLVEIFMDAADKPDDQHPLCAKWATEGFM